MIFTGLNERHEIFFTKIWKDYSNWETFYGQFWILWIWKWTDKFYLLFHGSGENNGEWDAVKTNSRMKSWDFWIALNIFDFLLLPCIFYIKFLVSYSKNNTPKQLIEITFFIHYCEDFSKTFKWIIIQFNCVSLFDV